MGKLKGACLVPWAEYQRWRNWRELITKTWEELDGCKARAKRPGLLLRIDKRHFSQWSEGFILQLARPLFPQRTTKQVKQRGALPQKLSWVHTPYILLFLKFHISTIPKSQLWAVAYESGPLWPPEFVVNPPSPAKQEKYSPNRKSSTAWWVWLP